MKTISEYIDSIEDSEKKQAFIQLFDVISQSIPKEYEAGISYGMIGWCVPHSIYPNGYHCDPKLPLPYVSIAAQKNFIALYHMGLYAEPKLYDWFISEYQKTIPTKVDAGKSCIRFKKNNQIPYELIGELLQKQSLQDWITLYENNLKSSSKKK